MESCERILTKFLGGIGHGPGTNEFNFGDDSDHCLDPGVRSLKSAFTVAAHVQALWLAVVGNALAVRQFTHH